MENIMNEFKIPHIIVETKSDIMKRETENIRVSAVTGEGMELLMERIREISDTLRIPEHS